MIGLSPFEVSATSDEGYSARETLAGTRFKTELKDVPAQISVMTEAFLQDIATANVGDAFRYSTNVENRDEMQAHGSGDFNGGVVDIGSTNRVRGLGQPGRTHDFHQTYIPGNTYNTERITFSSGPNSILFGNGNPAGFVECCFDYDLHNRASSGDSVDRSTGRHLVREEPSSFGFSRTNRPHPRTDCSTRSIASWMRPLLAT